MRSVASALAKTGSNISVPWVMCSLVSDVRCMGTVPGYGGEPVSSPPGTAP